MAFRCHDNEQLVLCLQWSARHPAVLLLLQVNHSSMLDRRRQSTLTEGCCRARWPSWLGVVQLTGRGWSMPATVRGSTSRSMTSLMRLWLPWFLAAVLWEMVERAKSTLQFVMDQEVEVQRSVEVDHPYLTCSCRLQAVSRSDFFSLLLPMSTPRSTPRSTQCQLTYTCRTSYFAMKVFVLLLLLLLLLLLFFFFLLLLLLFF